MNVVDMNFELKILKKNIEPLKKINEDIEE